MSRGTSRDEGVRSIFSTISCSSSGSLPLIFVLNHSHHLLRLTRTRRTTHTGSNRPRELVIAMGGKTAIFGSSRFTSKSNGSRDLSMVGSFSFDDGSCEAARPDFICCLIVLEKGSTMTVNVFLWFFFDDVALVLELFPGLNNRGGLPPPLCVPRVKFCD